MTLSISSWLYRVTQDTCDLATSDCIDEETDQQKDTFYNDNENDNGNFCKEIIFCDTHDNSWHIEKLKSSRLWKWNNSQSLTLNRFCNSCHVYCRKEADAHRCTGCIRHLLLHCNRPLFWLDVLLFLGDFRRSLNIKPKRKKPLFCKSLDVPRHECQREEVTNLTSLWNKGRNQRSTIEDA